LAGRAPYAESDAVLAAVKTGAPRPLAERQEGVPADLLAVVDRAMARDPAARYPTARELADDLRRFQAGQLVGAHRYTLLQLVARWVRRHRAAVAVAGCALAILAIASALALRRVVREDHRAQAARGVAERHRAQAEDLMGFMLFDLSGKLK